MEINLENLAGLMKPQMMLNTSTSSLGSVGGDATRGMMYGQDKAQFSDMLSQIAPIAQAQGQSQMQDLQAKQQMQPMEQAAKIKKMQLEALTPYASAWDAAKTDSEKEHIRSEIAADPSIPKQKPWDNMPLDVLDQHMKMTRAMGVNTPQHAQGMEQWGLRGDKAIVGKQATAAASMYGADARERSQALTSNNALEGRKLAVEAMKMKTADMAPADVWMRRKMEKGDATADDYAIFKYIKDSDQAVAAARQAAVPAQLDPEKLMPGMTKPVPAVQQPTPPKLTGKPKQNQPPPDYKPGDVWQDEKGKSKIVRTGKRGNTVVLQLEDGRVVDGQ